MQRADRRVDALAHSRGLSQEQWQLTLRVQGYEQSSPLLVNRGGGLDGSKFLSKLNDVVELKPLAGSGQARVLRLHIANRMRQGAVRELTLYAPYWLVNKTSLPLVYREVRLGTGLLNTAHAMERGSVNKDEGGRQRSVEQRSGESTPATAAKSQTTQSLYATPSTAKGDVRGRAISSIAVVPELMDSACSDSASSAEASPRNRAESSPAITTSNLSVGSDGLRVRSETEATADRPSSRPNSRADSGGSCTTR